MALENLAAFQCLALIAKAVAEEGAGETAEDLFITLTYAHSLFRFARSLCCP